MFPPARVLALPLLLGCSPSSEDDTASPPSCPPEAPSWDPAPADHDGDAWFEHKHVACASAETGWQGWATWRVFDPDTDEVLCAATISLTGLPEDLDPSCEDCAFAFPTTPAAETDHGGRACDSYDTVRSPDSYASFYAQDFRGWGLRDIADGHAQLMFLDGTGWSVINDRQATRVTEVGDQWYIEYGDPAEEWHEYEMR